MFLRRKNNEEKNCLKIFKSSQGLDIGGRLDKFTGILYEGQRFKETWTLKLIPFSSKYRQMRPDNA